MPNIGDWVLCNIRNAWIVWTGEGNKPVLVHKHDILPEGKRRWLMFDGGYIGI